MKMFSSVDECISKSPPEVAKRLTKIRKLIRSKIPDAIETISYGVPAYKLNNKPVIYFAGYKNHISIYPAPREEKEFKNELSIYKGGKGTIQFPNDKPVPYELIERIVDFRLSQLTT